jgi:hypothetical protein
MSSLRLNTANRWIGGLLLISLGTLVTLLTLTMLGSAVPAEKASPEINYFNASAGMLSAISRGTITAIDSNGHVEGPIPISTLIQSPDEWKKQPIRFGAEIATGVTVALGLLYLGLKQLYRNISKEVFP